MLNITKIFKKCGRTIFNNHTLEYNTLSKQTGVIQMIGTLICIQSACVLVSSVLTYRRTKRLITLELVKKNKNGFKHYKVKGV